MTILSSTDPLREWLTCRLCGSRLQSILDLGPIHVSAFPAPHEPDSLRAPLDWCRCVDCGMVQLRHSVDPQYLYQTYWYRSGVNETMVAELRSIAEAALPYLHPNDTVIDIGANDGTLLHQFPDTVRKVAWEPAANLQAILQTRADDIIADVFPPRVPGLPTPSAKVITTIACYYDTDDPVGFAWAVKDRLHPQGVWILQFQDLQQMVTATAFDNICHEHVWYPSLDTIRRIAERVELEIQRAEHRSINGGSLRVVLQHPGAHPVQASVSALYAYELGGDFLTTATLERFAGRVRQRQAQIRGTIAATRARGQTIDLYAASTKANTLLQTCGITAADVRQAWERSPEKVGRRTVGSGIPIVSEAEGRRDPPQVLLLGAWQFAEAFVRREAAFLEIGGTMLVPLPEVNTIWHAGRRRA